MGTVTRGKWNAQVICGLQLDCYLLVVTIA